MTVQIDFLVSATTGSSMLSHHCPRRFGGRLTPKLMDMNSLLVPSLPATIWRSSYPKLMDMNSLLLVGFGRVIHANLCVCAETAVLAYPAIPDNLEMVSINFAAAAWEAAAPCFVNTA